VTFAQADSTNCDIKLSDYLIYQKGYNDTSLNTAYSGTGDYDASLVSPLEDNGTNIVMKFLTHVVTAGTMPLKTFDSVSKTVCNLENLLTTSCV